MYRDLQLPGLSAHLPSREVLCANEAYPGRSPLGRPFGAPNQAALPSEVLEATLELLQRASLPPFIAEYDTGLADLEVFCPEGATAQPGPTSSKAALDWFWSSTLAAELLWRLRDALGQDEDPLVRIHAAAPRVPSGRP